MANREKKPAPLVELRFTCPDCGSTELSHCCGGFVHGKFVEAIAYTPEERLTESKSVKKKQGSEIRYACRPDGTEDCDCVEDDYDVDSLQCVACLGCESVLEFESGGPVQNETELVEWLLENQAEPNDTSSRVEENDTGE